MYVHSEGLRLIGVHSEAANVLCMRMRNIATARLSVLRKSGICCDA